MRITSGAAIPQRSRSLNALASRVICRMHRVSSPGAFAVEALEAVVAAVFPSQCVVCREPLRRSLFGGICGDCWPLIEPWKGPACSRCGLPLAGAVPARGYLCADCRRSGFPFEAARSFGVYSGALRTALLSLKFRGRERLGTRLGRLLLQPCKDLDAEAGFTGRVLLIPVPLHPTKERERGYNQASLLALGLWRAWRKHGQKDALQLARRVLVRLRSGPPQSGLSLRARQENVRGVFAVAGPERVRDRDVVLVDDVLTTGATASACTLTLKRAGARRVAVLTLARATPQFPDAVSLPQRPRSGETPSRGSAG